MKLGSSPSNSPPQSMESMIGTDGDERERGLEAAAATGARGS